LSSRLGRLRPAWSGRRPRSPPRGAYRALPAASVGGQHPVRAARASRRGRLRRRCAGFALTEPWRARWNFAAWRPAGAAAARASPLPSP